MSISITSIFMALTASDKFSSVVSKGVLLANLVNMHLESNLFMSLRYIRKMIGPKMEPWGTPSNMNFISDTAPLMLSNCFLSYK